MVCHCLDAVEITVIQEEAAREAANAWWMDFVTSAAPQAVQALLDNPDVNMLVSTGGLAYKYIGLNLTRATPALMMYVWA